MKAERRTTDATEPPLDELYAKYVAFMNAWRKSSVSRAAGDCTREEWAAKAYQPVSKDDFVLLLAEKTQKGFRVRFVNQLVFGYDYCAAHPDDPLIKVTPKDKLAQIAEILGEVIEVQKNETAFWEHRSDWVKLITDPPGGVEASAKHRPKR